MQGIFSILFVLALTFGGLQAQDKVKEYKAHQDGWLVSLDKAYEESQRTGKPILANFTGSDWCGWCKRLTKSVFIHDSFNKWAGENVVLLELDFPKRTQVPAEIKTQNTKLQRAFKVGGFPTIWLFDLNKIDGKYTIVAHGKTGYTASVEEFTSAINQMLEQRKGA